MEIALAPEPVFKVGELIITNTMITSVLVVVLLTAAAAVYRSVLSVTSPGRYQSLVEWALTFVLNLCEQAAGRALGRRIFPLVATFFIFILTANWLGLLPGSHFVKVVNFEGHEVPLFRAANSDLNMTAAMALVAVGTVQVLGVVSRGFGGYLKELLTPVYLAPIHLIGEVSRVISLSGRLFGNIFGGEVLMLLMYTLVPYVVPAVFLGLEVLFGFIQALIFTVLTVVYITLAAAPEHREAV
ncbi:MAG: F0F1 ATP synthase subunit A [Anaerolineae bacterium]|nr:F0F1 ATP synthase subunit A [Anaerolineae bacterium]